MKQIVTLILLCTILPLYALEQEVTYIVTSKTSVLAEGNEPVGSMATFAQTGTGQKGQMTADNSTLFTLTGLQGLYLHKVTLQMRSNSTAGAGMLQMTVGEDILWQINQSSFATEQWNGSFTTAWTPIAWSVTPSYLFDQHNSLSIHITATENSLYVASYTITYSTEAPTPYTVQFHTGTNQSLAPLTENGVGEGLILPSCQAADSIWYFTGWIDTPIASTNDKNQLPPIYAAGERFYPLGNTTLYALYCNTPNEANLWVQDTIFASGYYIMVDSLWNTMPHGATNSQGRIEVFDLEITQLTNDGYAIFPKAYYLDEVVYFIDFLPDSLAMIQHVETQQYIGYPRTVSGKLTKDSVAWNYRVTPGKEVVFYHAFGSEWVQLRTKPDNSGDPYYQAYKTTFTKCANILFNIDDCPEIVQSTYTSYPLGTAINNTLSPSVRVTPIGISNPENATLCLYNVLGIKILTTHTDISFAAIPSGVYLLQINQSMRKIYVY